MPKNNDPIKPTQTKKSPEEIRKALQEAGINEDSLRRSFKTIERYADPMGKSEFGDPYDASEDTYTYDQSWGEDLAASLYNGLVVEGGRGVANIIPTLADAFTPQDLEWASAWTKNVNEYMDGQKLIYSDQAYQEMKDWSDINASHWATGIGQGVGFVLGIMGGSTWGSAIGAVSKASKGTKAMQTAAKWGGRAGSFMSGTTLMYPMIYEEARQNGISPGNAARVALVASSIVSMTEGAALEWIGKSITSPLTQKATKGIVRKGIKEAGQAATLNETLLAGRKVADGLLGKIKSSLPTIAQSGAIEFGQEFSQTYIEEGIKQMYDIMVAPQSAEAGKGKFGADPFGEKTKETFVESVFSGVIGSIIGSGMGAISIANDPSHETVYGFMQRAVDKNQVGKLKKVDEQMLNLLNEGEITKEEYDRANANIKEMQTFAYTMKGLDIQDGTTNYQLYQLNNLRKEARQKYKELPKERIYSPAIQAEYDKRNKQIEEVAGEIDKTMAVMIKSKKPFSNEKNTFDTAINKFKKLIDDVSTGRLNGEVKEAVAKDPELQVQTKIFTDSNNQYKLDENVIRNFNNFKRHYDRMKSESLTESDKELARIDLENELRNTEMSMKDFDFLYENYNKINEQYIKKELQEWNAEKQSAEDVDTDISGTLDVDPNLSPEKQKIQKEINTLKDILEKEKASEFKSDEFISELEQNIAELEESLSPGKKLTDEEQRQLDIDAIDKTIDTKSRTLSALQSKEKQLQNQLKQAKDEQKRSEIQARLDEITPQIEALSKELEADYKTREDLLGGPQEQQDKEGQSKKQRKTKSKKKPISKRLVYRSDDNILYKGKRYRAVLDENNKVTKLETDEFTLEPAEVTTKSVIDAVNKQRGVEKQDYFKNTESLEKENTTLVKDLGQYVPSIEEQMSEIDPLLEENLTDEIAEVLNEGLPEEVTPELLQKLDYYIDNITEQIYEKYPNNEYGEQIFDALIDLKNSYNYEYQEEYQPVANEQGQYELFSEQSAEQGPQTNVEEQQKVTKPTETTEETSDIQPGIDVSGEQPTMILTTKKEVVNDDDVNEMDAVLKKLEEKRNQEKAKEQRVPSIADTKLRHTHQLNVNSNPELYNAIKDRMKKIFPGISVETMDEVVSRVGVRTLGKVLGKTIYIDENNAVQSTLLHEYGHVLVELLKDKNSELLKKGLELIENTKYYEEAQKLYPNLSKAEQLEEALTQAIAEIGVDSIEQNMNSNVFEKFRSWLKRMWLRIKNLFGKANNDELMELLSNMMVFPMSIKLNYGGDISLREQKSEQDMMINDLVQNTINEIKIEQLLDKESIPIDFSNPNNLAVFVFRNIKNIYQKEKESGDRKYFDGINFDIELDQQITNDFGDLKKITTHKETLKFISQVRAVYPELYNGIIKISELVSNKTIDEANLENEENAAFILDQEDTTKTNLIVKKDISASVRSILTSMVDYEYRHIDKDKVSQYVSETSAKTFGLKQFEDQVAKDAQTGNSIVAIRLNAIFENYRNRPSIKNTFLTELSSLVGVHYHKIVLDKQQGSDKLMYKVRNLNENYEYSISEIEQKFKSLERGSVYRELKDKARNVQTNYEKVQNLEEFLKDKKLLQDAKDVLEYFTGFRPNESTFRYLTGNQTANMFFTINSYLSGFKSKRIKVLDKAFISKDNQHNFYKKLVSMQSSAMQLTGSFINSAGSMQNSVRMGFWITEKNKMIKHKPGHIDSLLSSKSLTENNPILKYFKDAPFVQWSVFDAMDFSENEGQVKEYKNLTEEEMLKQSFITYMFATSINKKNKTINPSRYFQRIGLTGDRSYITAVEVPTGNKTSKQFMSDYESYVNNQYKKLVKNSPEKAALYKKNLPTMSILKYDAQNDKFKFDNALLESRIKRITDIVKADKFLIEQFKDKTNGGLPLVNFVQDYYINEAINRHYLTDIYMGPPALRKNVNDLNKRYPGANSGMSKIEFPADKEVYHLVVDFPTPENVKGQNDEVHSDSFEWYGHNMWKHIKEKAGDLDVVGANIKGQLFQTNHETGDLAYLKHSALGLTSNNREDNNFKESNEDYAIIADALIQLEQKLGDNAFVVVVDSKTIKGDNVFGEQITFDQMQKYLNNQDIDGLSKKMKGVKYENFGISFNINKDLSKVPLSKQKSKFANQLAIGALNGQSRNVIAQFQSKLVSLLRKNIGAKKGGTVEESAMIQQMMDHPSVIQGLLANSERSAASYATKIFESIRDMDLSDTDIKLLDHPNIKAITESFIGSKLSKGLKAELPGALLHAMPDLKGKLKFYAHENGVLPTNKRGDKIVAEIALTWSLFGKTKEDAEAALERYKTLRDQDEVTKEEKEEYDALREKFTTGNVRVPHSGGMSTFVSEVAYFLPGDTNAAIVPQGFLEASDSDHDGDKLFVYRADLNDEGEVKRNSVENLVVNQLKELLTSERIIKESDLNLKLDGLKAIAKELNAGKSGENLLRDAMDLSKSSVGYTTGIDAVGKFAVSLKFMNALSQSKARLQEPKKMIINGTTYNLTSITDAGFHDMGIMLQAALDMAKDPVLIELGMTEENIPLITTMLMFGVQTKDIAATIKNNVLMKSRIENGVKKYIDQDIAYFDELSKEINSLIPILQLDAGLPQKGYLVRNTLKAFENATKLKKLNVTEFLQRPIYKHYQEVLKAQQTVLKSYFATEHENMYTMYEYVREFTKGYTKTKFDSDVMQLMAQKMLPQEYQQADGVTIDNTLQNTVNKIVVAKSTKEDIIKNFKPENPMYWTPNHKTLIKSIDGGMSIDEAIESQSKGFIKDKMEETKSSLKRDLERYYESINEAENNTFEGNKFIEQLFVRPSRINKKKNVIFVRDSFRKSQPSLKEEIVKDFFKLPEDLQQDLFQYQLLVSGVEQKRNTIVEILPSDIINKYQNTLSNNAYSAEFVNAQFKDNVLTRNLLAMNSDKVKDKKVAPTATVYSVSGQVKINKNKPVMISNYYFYNGGYFYKGGWKMESFTKEDVDLQRDQLEEMKKCLN